MLVILLARAALGAPDITVSDDGTIVATALVPASESDVRAALADPKVAASLSPEVLEVETEADGPCERVTRRTRGFLRPLRMFALRCPTERGWREDLLEPGDFRAYSSEWVLRPEGDATHIEYRVSTELAIPVPRAALRAGLVASTKTLLDNLVHRVSPSPGG